MSDWNKKVIAEFRANKGKVGGYFADAIVLLLHTSGAKTGLPRLNPLLCYPTDDFVVIIASKGGADTHPDWYYNLVANPEVEVEIGEEKYKALATVAIEPERSQLYDLMATKHHIFAEYKIKADRIIPVIKLIRQ